MLYNGRELSVLGEYDVIVAGSGPAGLCAAVASARNAAKTAIVERYGILGGNLTSGHVGPVMGRIGEGTLAGEVNRMIGTKLPIARVAPDFERAKTAFPAWMKKEGVDIFLQSPVIDVVQDANDLRGIIVSTPDGPGVLTGKCIVDATGDGFVSFLAGEEYEKGRKEDHLMQPVTLMFRLAGLDMERMPPLDSRKYNLKVPGMSLRELGKEAAKTGLLPEKASFVRIYRGVRDGECMINTTQANFIDGTNVYDIEKAECDLRDQIYHVTEFLRGHIEGFENAYVTSSSSTLGVRETRRIMGTYVLNDADIEKGRKFEDMVVHNAEFIVDIHHITKGGQQEDRKVPPYDIPYRCLVPKRIDHLLLAGRCISGTHRAMASYRVMNICMAIGQASGVAASLCAQKGIKPRELDYQEVQKALTTMGVNLYD